MKRKIAAILLVFSLAVGLCVFAGADFGDYGGDYDYGGYDDYDYDYDYDFGDDYDDDYYDYDYDDDDDDGYYYYGGFTGGNSSSGGFGDTVSGLIGLIIIGIIIFAVIKSRGKKKSGENNSANTGYSDKTKAGYTDINRAAYPRQHSFMQSNLRNTADYLKIDPGFSEHNISQKISNLYVRFQNSWTNKSIDDLRPYLTDTMFAQCDRQLDFYRKNNQTNFVEHIAVLSVSIAGWYSEGGFDYIVARLKTRITDYVVDDNSGRIIKGSNTAEKFMEYEWTLTRPAGRLTSQSKSGTTVQNCPNCGAPVNINRSAKCEYCDSILTTDDFDWVVSEIKGISQRTE